MLMSLYSVPIPLLRVVTRQASPSLGSTDRPAWHKNTADTPQHAHNTLVL